ncbi:MAG TPA: anti-phage ZorAB system protein ZorA [Edaphobacter sp.]|nr:anti-phage ZorAB system protein ZorA [Edaphobacter sp.]
MAATFLIADLLLPWMDVFGGIRTVASSVGLWAGGKGSEATELVSSPAFVGTLAWSIGAVGAGLLLAFAVVHVLAVRLSLWQARKLFGAYEGPASFAAAYETAVYPRIIRHPLVGHAWQEFDETLLKHDPSHPMRNTVRPQAFINYGLMREMLPGLKMIGSISGYFVGIGLLLTFIGIVIALNTAAGSVAAGTADQMTTAMKGLLQIASLKFTTSIAGLGTSIVFAFFSRLFIVWIESACSKLCEAIEQKLQFAAPQSITAEMNEVAKEQRDQLKELNSERYFTRLADAVERSMATAVGPMVGQFGSAVEELKKASANTGADMAREISASLRGSAGAELQALGQTLQETQRALETIQGGLLGSGQDFSRQLAEAAENLGRLVSQAGSNLQSSTDQSRASLEQVVAALQATLESANRRVDEQLGSAASGAAARLEQAMGSAMSQLERQVGEFGRRLAEFESGAAANLAETRAAAQQAQGEAVAAVGAASAEAAKALQVGLADALQRISDEVGRFQSAMQAGGIALSNQAAAIGDATGKARAVADAFASTAREVREATGPLLQSGQQMARVSSEMSGSMGRAVESLARAEAASSTLAGTLAGHIERLTSTSATFRDSFERIDEDLARAVALLAEANEAHAGKLTDYLTQVDGGIGDAITKLRAFVVDLTENTEELADNAKLMAEALSRRPGA